MIASIKLLKPANKTKKEHNIVVELYYSDKKRPRLTLAKTLPEFWDAEISEPLKQHQDYYHLLPVIRDYKAKCAKVNYGNYSFQEAYDIVFSDVPKKKHENGMLLDFFDVIIEERKIKNQSSRNFENVKNILIGYLGENRDMPINDVTYEWLNKFMLHKLAGNCNLGGVMSYLRTLRTVYKEAQRRTSLNINKDNPFLGIIKEPAPKPVIELSKKDLAKLFKFKPKPSTTEDGKFKMQRNIDMFLLQFYTGGIDYIDLACLKWDQIQEGRIKLQRYKLRNKRNAGPKINNWLSPEALSIIEKYGNKKSKRIFDFIPDPEVSEKDYLNFTSNLNRSLGHISNILELPKLSSKKPRYLFRTYAGELLIHDLIVMKLQGHKPEGVSYRYQGNIDLSIQDEAHKKIIQLTK